MFLSNKKHTLLLWDTKINLHPQKYGPSICKSADADACADEDTDWCSYVLYDPSFCYLRMRIHMDADQSILDIILL